MANVGLHLGFRHTCEQHAGMAGYGWDEYDVRQGGRQTIHDAGNKLDLITEFVKFPGGEHGGSWAVRVKGTLREDADPKQKSTVIFYSAMDGPGELGVQSAVDPLGFEEDVDLAGQTKELGEFQIKVTRGPDSNRHPKRTHQTYGDKPLDRTMVSSLQVPPEAIWQSVRKCGAKRQF